MGAGDEVGDGRELAAPEDAVGERRGRRREHGVEGEQQEGLLAPEPDREAERRDDEERHRCGGRVADEGRSEREPEERPDRERAEPRRRGCQKAGRVRDEGVREPGLGRDEGREPAEEEQPLACEQEPAGSEGPHHRCGVCQGLVLHDVRRSAGG